MPTPNIAELAETFANVVREWTGDPAVWSEIDRRNATEEYDSVCATHDFIDANMAMFDAFAAFGIEFNPHDAEHVALWNAAWGRAKTDGFFDAGQAREERDYFDAQMGD